MVPVTFVKLVNKLAGQHGIALNNVLAKTFSNDDEASLMRQCSIESLEKAVNDILLTVPESMCHHLEYLVSFIVRRDPLSHELLIAPIFTPEGLMNTLNQQGVINSSRLSTIDESDTFKFNGSRKPVEHSLSEQHSGISAGAFVELTLSDNSVSVWTISPEELSEARQIWQQRYFGDKSYENLSEMIIMLRAVKSLQSTVLFNDQTQLGELLGNIEGYYNAIFTRYEQETKKRFASSVDVRSRFISNQESEIEKLMNDLDDEVDLAYGKRINIQKQQKLEPENGQVISIGTSGW